MALHEDTIPADGDHHTLKGNNQKQSKRVIVPRGGAQPSNPGAANEESRHGADTSQVFSNNRGQALSRSIA